MSLHPKYIAIAGDDRLEHPRSAEVTIRRAVRHLAAHRPPVLWLASAVGASNQIAVDELLARGQVVRILLPYAPSFLARRCSPTCRRTLAEQVALAESIRPVPTKRHTAASSLARQLAQVADLLVVFWHGDVRTSETVAPIFEARFREVPVYWVPLR